MKIAFLNGLVSGTVSVENKLVHIPYGNGGFLDIEKQVGILEILRAENLSASDI